MLQDPDDKPGDVGSGSADGQGKVYLNCFDPSELGPHV